MSTLVELHHRHHGTHKIFKAMEIKEDVIINGEDDPEVDEELLLKALGDKFLPNLIKTNRILLIVDDVAVSKPKLFRAWGKYYDTWAVHLRSEELKETK